MAEYSGRCLCGAVSYQTKTLPLWTALCHCESCRRACSAPVVAWMGFKPADLIWHGERTFYQSSTIASRGFCAQCGSQLSFESSRWPGEIHLYAATLDEPTDYAPQLHCHTGEALDWLHLEDDLPRHHGSAEP